MTQNRLPTAIVLASDATGLAVIRSLAKVLVPTIVILKRKNDVVFNSKLPEKKLVLDDSMDMGTALDAVLNEFRGKGYYLLATTDLFLNYMIKNRDDLSEAFALLIPDSETISTLVDKSQETTLIHSLGIPIPKTLTNLTPDPDRYTDSLQFPIIFKPQFETVNNLKAKNIVVNDRCELQDLLKTYETHLSSLIAQEVIPGDESASWLCSATFNAKSELASAFSFNRLSSSPKHFGVTSHAISRLNKDLISMSQSVGKSLNLIGPADIEFKYDYRDQQLKYIEINPRTGMCTYFDTSCGINNVANAYFIAIDRPDLVKKDVQVDNVIFLCLYDDMYSRLKSGESIFAVLKIYLSQLSKKHVWLYFKLNDPLPAVFRLLGNVKDIFKSIIAKIRHKF